jgi:glycosyltransferase involved in cell wall biosynthesis
MIKNCQKFISIIIPTFNEGTNSFYTETLKSLASIPDLELIIVDRSSQDQTQCLAQKYGAKVIKSTNNTRAARLNEGIFAATGKIILLHHPRSKIDTLCIEYLKKNYHNISWGGLIHSFDFEHPLLKFTSWYSNNIRAKMKQILYLDHCIFFRQDLLNLSFKGKKIVPEVDIFEDTLLSFKLQKLGDPTLIPYSSKTSIIRFKKVGIFKQSFLNQVLKLAFVLGYPVKSLNKIYENDLSLNSKYISKGNP